METHMDTRDLRESILAANDLALTPVDIPEWNTRIFVRMMTGGQRDKFEAEFLADKTTNLRARLVDRGR